MPTDADLVLVTHGHFDHSSAAPELIKKSTNPECKLIVNYELGEFFKTERFSVSADKIVQMKKGGVFETGFCRVAMVSADHSSGCNIGLEEFSVGGDACGFVIEPTISTGEN